ncbi:MAG: DUF885 domain-containing protein [Bdellovibrionota bacterium]|nr:DUF885 domain-containing protein [Bdellovibrionota bacterium]
MKLPLVLLLGLLMSSCALVQYTPKEREENTKKLNAFFERVFEENVKRYPTWQTYIGLKTNYGKLNNATEEFQLESLEISKRHLKELKEFSYRGLTHQGQLSYKLFKKDLEEGIEGWKWRYHRFPLNQMFGYHSGLPSFMVNMHRITNLQEAKDYLSRLKEFNRVFKERMVYVQKQKDMGILPPAFVYDKVIGSSENIIKGIPFGGKKKSPLYEDFSKKISKLKISKKKKSELLKEARLILVKDVQPVYKDLIAFLKEAKAIKKDNHGAWSLPNGDEYYRWRLEQITTTDMSPSEIHDFGLREVDRIHGEMKGIMKKVGFKGSLKEFFQHMRTSPKYVYPDTKKGRAAYLKRANTVIDEMEAALPKMFNTLPKADLLVKAVEPYREKSAGIAFYQSPPLFGDRPGIYYVNLYNMKDVPKYKIEALAYHEGLPGHHMQNAVQSELTDLPKFRRTGGYTAYGEGWGLYSELLPKEFGFYKDPYSDFGRLSMELWRACRLVTDTGLHAKKWTREEAIKYLEENTANADLEIVKGIERYIVNPGQATAYKIGMQKILDLRSYAKEELGAKFDIRDYHDVILRNGAVPLDVMEDLVHKWVDETAKM